MHGGDIYRNKVTLDYSVNTNPLGVCEEVKKALLSSMEEVEHYPDYYCEELKEALAEYHQLKPEQILCGNGASEIITAVCRYVQPKKVLLPVPGFSGYEKALKAVGAGICYVLSQADSEFAATETIIKAIREQKPDMLFLTNPNNPTGQLLSKKSVDKIVAACDKAQTFLVVDECFIELTMYRDESLLYRGIPKNALVLRAFTKSYAIPGVRLGYAVVANKELRDGVEEQLSEWSVSIPAQKAGLVALQEEAYLERARLVIAQERERLRKELKELGLQVFPSSANYILIYDPAEDDSLYRFLLRWGILIRDCSDYYGLSQGYYRIAVKMPEENDQLLSRIKECFYARD